jgi:hypothetical protein
MKRKLTKRNKQFLSSRYTGYSDGKYSFQMLYYYVFDKNGVAKQRTMFDWTFSTAYTYRTFEALIADLEVGYD